MDYKFIRICASGITVMIATTARVISKFLKTEPSCIRVDMKIQNCYDNLDFKSQCAYLHHFILLIPCSWSCWIYLFFAYPGVSSLLEFLCNGLVRGHDNKHLDGHVEDAHGDQVGHIVSVERQMHKRLSTNSSQ